MGTDNTDPSVNHHITDALRHAMLMHGESLVYDPNLLEILRDHGAFVGFDCADEIIGMLIDNSKMPKLLSLSRMDKDSIIDGVDKEVCNLRYMCSFHERDIRTVILSVVKGMNMNLDLPRMESYAMNRLPRHEPAICIADTIEIDPDDLIEPPSCPIPPRKKKKEVEEASEYTIIDLNSIPLKSDVQIEEEKERHIKKKIRNSKNRRFTILFAIAIVISCGMYAALNIDFQKKDSASPEVKESQSDRIYREILEDIQSHNGHISTEGLLKLDKALKEYPEDYWFNFLKEKTK